MCFSPLVVYILAALWGAGDAIWQTQINALYGVLFASDEEADSDDKTLNVWISMLRTVAYF